MIEGNDEYRLTPPRTPHHTTDCHPHAHNAAQRTIKIKKGNYYVVACSVTTPKNTKL